MTRVRGSRCESARWPIAANEVLLRVHAAGLDRGTCSTSSPTHYAAWQPAPCEKDSDRPVTAYAAPAVDPSVAHVLRGLLQPPGQLGSGPHVQLPERLVQVVLDRARADEELGGDLSVRASARRQAGDLLLLWRQIIDGVGGVTASMLACRFQLDSRALSERLDAERVEQAARRPQLLARIEASASTPEPFPVEQMRAGEVDGHPSSTQPLDGLHVQVLGDVVVREQRFGARGDPDGPVRR